MSEQLTEPRSGECLLCYLLRMVPDLSCDGTLRWSTRWRDAQPRPPRTLLRRLERGGGYCDCEVIMNVYRRELEEGIEPPGECPHRGAG